MAVAELTEAWQVHPGPYSEAEYLALPEDKRHRVELVDGAIHMSPMASRQHQRTAMRLLRQLADACPARYEVTLEINVRVGRDRILIPDFTVVSTPDTDGLVADAAEVLLVGEVVSPSSVSMDRVLKPNLYAQAGIRHYVRVEDDTVFAHDLVDGRYRERKRETDGSVHLSEPFPVVLR